jgi:hypothetical protein
MSEKTINFINKATKIWGKKYDYSKVEVINSTQKIIIICKEHGEYNQLTNNHLKYGCGKCGRELNVRNKKLNKKCKDNFIEKANIAHNNIYEYSYADYKNCVTKLIVTCKLHGNFDVSPNNHLNGKGCPKCGIYRASIFKIKDFEEYKNYFTKLYNDKYDYSKVIWDGSSKPIIVVCKIHGDFNILPYVHKKGRECPKCTNQFSPKSIMWLLFMEVRYSIKIQHALSGGEYNIPDTKYKADGYCEDINTIFEFHGDFWHGNPSIYDSNKTNPRNGLTYGELYEKTVLKINILQSKDYKVIQIWENDFNKFVKAIRKLQLLWKKDRLFRLY